MVLQGEEAHVEPLVDFVIHQLVLEGTHPHVLEFLRADLVLLLWGSGGVQVLVYAS